MIQQKQMEAENKLLHKRHHDMDEELRKLSKDIFLIEENWNELMTLQNYYYILQDSEWRQLNDWIHIDLNGVIQSPLQAINYCKTKNIRLRSDCSGFSIKIFFDNETSKHLEKMRSISPEAGLLKKVKLFRKIYLSKLKQIFQNRIWKFSNKKHLIGSFNTIAPSGCINK